MIAIVDFGSGNIGAFVNAYNGLGIPLRVAKKSDDLEGATKIILPGVGAFDDAMEKLEQSGMRPALDDLVLRQHVPVVGVCVGMQMLAASSEEGKLRGLGWIDGDVKRFEPTAIDGSIRVPHMGWNNVQQLKATPLFDGLEVDSRFYFLHSFYLECHRAEDVVAVTDHGGEFVAAVSSGNVFGVQFHPEKSHGWGRRLLENFAAL
jgi:imidazole glycerol-phosphate synthase subunit HisH